MEGAVQGQRQWVPRACLSPQDKKPSAAPQMGNCAVDPGWPALSEQGCSCHCVLRVRLGILGGSGQEGERGKQVVAAPLGGDVAKTPSPAF